MENCNGQGTVLKHKWVPTNHQLSGQIEILTKTPRLDRNLYNSLRSITSENIAVVKASVLVLSQY